MMINRDDALMTVNGDAALLMVNGFDVFLMDNGDDVFLTVNKNSGIFDGHQELRYCYWITKMMYY